MLLTRGISIIGKRELTKVVLQPIVCKTDVNNASVLLDIELKQTHPSSKSLVSSHRPMFSAIVPDKLMLPRAASSALMNTAISERCVGVGSMTTFFNRESMSLAREKFNILVIFFVLSLVLSKVVSFIFVICDYRKIKSRHNVWILFHAQSSICRK